MNNRLVFIKISLFVIFGGTFMSCTSIRDHFVRNMLNDWEERDKHPEWEESINLNNAMLEYLLNY